MKLTIDIDENEIQKMAKEIVAQKVADDVFGDYRSGKYCYRHAIKDIVREVIKSDIDNLSTRAIDAAAVSITNKGLKKVSAEELLARIAGRDGE